MCACSGKGGVEVLQHTHDVLAVAWAPSGKLLASATLDGQIYFWDPLEAQLQACLLTALSSIWSSECNLTDLTASLWNIRVQKERSRGDANGIDRGWAVLWLIDVTAAVGRHLFLFLLFIPTAPHHMHVSTYLVIVAFVRLQHGRGRDGVT